MREAGPIDDTILVAGERVLVQAPVRTWHESGLEFTTRSARTTTSCVTLHWTGAENPPEALHRNMSASRLSVHFAIDAAGVVWQFMDAGRFGAHCQAHGANGYAVGIELINRGVGLTLPDRGVVRATRVEKIHGKRVTYAAFTTPQVASCLALCEALCAAYRLPMQVPTIPSGDVLATNMSLADARRFKGVAGHFQFERSKVDPGLELLRAVQQRGIELRNAGPGVA